MVDVGFSADIPFDIGPAYMSPGAAGLAIPNAMRWDCSVGGVPFLFAMSRQYPFKRETAAFRRDRVDTQRNPGEQSLDSGYWLRSQASFHYGSGLSSAEPLEVSDQEAQFRYKQGGGVDIWTAGQVTLLKDTTHLTTSAGSTQLLIGVDTGVLHADGATLTYVTVAGSPTTVTWGGSGTITSITTDGTSYYAADATGIYKGTLPSGAGSLLWNTGATTVIRWVKSRLMAAIGVSLYELADTTGAPTLPTALYTHPSSGWGWTDIAEGPAGIYVSGYSSDTSEIMKIDVTSTATTVDLAQPVVVADLPRGETVKSLYSYVGSYLIVGTSMGVRVALINTDGSLSLGPLVVECSDGVDDAVASGSYVYVTVGAQGDAGDRATRAGLYRIDLGTNLNGEALQFAHAADLVAPSGTSGNATQVTVAGGLLHFVVSGNGIYQESADYVDEGWLETGRIRMGTVESKVWRSLRITGDPAHEGATVVYASASESSAPSTWTRVFTNTQTEPDQTGSMNSAAPVPLSSIYVAFNLTRGATTTDSPVFNGYQLKSVPAPVRSELLSIPVQCFDMEKDRQNVPYGSAGGAWLRFQALKALEAAAGTVQWLDFTTGEAAEGFIEKVSWDRVTPPTRNEKSPGGIVTLLLRLV